MRSKEKAKEKYDDAIASGNAAILAESPNDKKEITAIKVGNLMPK